MAGMQSHTKKNTHGLYSGPAPAYTSVHAHLLLFDRVLGGADALGDGVADARERPDVLRVFTPHCQEFVARAEQLTLLRGRLLRGCWKRGRPGRHQQRGPQAEAKHCHVECPP